MAELLIYRRDIRLDRLSHANSRVDLSGEIHAQVDRAYFATSKTALHKDLLTS